MPRTEDLPDEAEVRTEGGVKAVLADADRNLVMIPNLAIHMNREVNEGYKYSVQTDMLPLLGGPDASLKKIMAAAAGVDADDIISSDLFLYNRTAPSIWGSDNEYLSAPRLDDLACAYASLEGFLTADTDGIAAVHALFDNEEVGSSTIQGAASTFLKDVLTRIKVEGAMVNLSGFDTQIRNALSGMQASGEEPGPLIREAFEKISDSMIRMITQDAEQTKTGSIYMSGGVASSRFIRSTIADKLQEKGIQAYFAGGDLSSDNAVGTALLGERYLWD